MAGQVRLLTANNLRANLAGPQYPDQIVLRGRDLDYFSRISDLIETMDEINGRQNELILQNDYFFGGDAKMWGLILDLLFPYELPERHMPSHELFLFNSAGNPYLNPNRDVTMDDLRSIVDYFMIGEGRNILRNPRVMDDILLRFAYMRPDAPQQPRYAEFTISPARLRNRERASLRAIRNAPVNNSIPPLNNNEWGNNLSNNENQGPEIGYTEEEEEALGRLSGANARRYFRGGRTRRSSRKLNKKTRKH